MKAAVLERFGEKLSVREVHKPTLSLNEVLIRVKAAGMCSTDLSLRDGADPTIGLPRILGHEIAGEVIEIETDKESPNLKVGDKVVASVYVTCKSCSFCRTGRENLCIRVKRIGFDIDGGYAEFVKIPCENAFKIPDNLSFTEAAILPDAVAVMLHAIKSKAQLVIGQTVMIQGVGGLGIHGVQIAKACGASVIAVDVREERLEDARKYGADTVINAEKGNVANIVRELTNSEGVDAVIEVVSVPYKLTEGIQSKAFKDAIYSAKRGGKVVIVGYEIPTLQVDPRYMFLNELEIIGCRASTKEELKEVIELTKWEKIKPVVSGSFSLDDINRGFQELALGNVSGRAVVLL